MAMKDQKPGKKDRTRSEDDKLDEALRDTFPASDPPAITEPHKHLGSGKKKPETGKPAADKVLVPRPYTR